MGYTKAEIIIKVKKLVDSLRKKHNIKAAYIFGSCSKGNAVEASDIDIALILDKIRNGSPFNETFEIFHEAQQHSSLYEVICFQEKEFINEEEPIIKHIKKEGIKVF